MQDKNNRRNDLLALTTDLRTKRRREGEALQAFEKIIDRFVSLSAVRGRDKPSPKPKYNRLRPHEVVIWEAPDPRQVDEEATRAAPTGTPRSDTFTVTSPSSSRSKPAAVATSAIPETTGCAGL